jgi:hypothetical protein
LGVAVSQRLEEVLVDAVQGHHRLRLNRDAIVDEKAREPLTVDERLLVPAVGAGDTPVSVMR